MLQRVYRGSKVRKMSKARKMSSKMDTKFYEDWLLIKMDIIKNHTDYLGKTKNNTIIHHKFKKQLDHLDYIDIDLKLRKKLVSKLVISKCSKYCYHRWSLYLPDEKKTKVKILVEIMNRGNSDGIYTKKDWERVIKELGEKGVNLTVNSNKRRNEHKTDMEIYRQTFEVIVEKLELSPTSNIQNKQQKIFKKMEITNKHIDAVKKRMTKSYQYSSRRHIHSKLRSINKDGLIILLVLVNKGNKSDVNDLYNCVMGRNERAKKRLVDKMTRIYMSNNNKYITKHKGATKSKVVKRKVYRNPKTGARYHQRKSKTTGRMYKQYLPRK